MFVLVVGSSFKARKYLVDLYHSSDSFVDYYYTVVGLN